MVFGVFDTKSTDSVSFSTTFGELFLVYFTGNTLSFFGYSPPVSVGVGSEIGQICGVFSSKDSKNAHFFDLLNGYIHPNNFKNKKQAWGFAPNPTHTARPQGQVANPIHLPLR